MKQLQNALHNVNENILCGSRGFSARGDTRLCKFNVPVAVNVPDKVVELSDSDTEFKRLDIVGNLADKLVVKRKNPLVLDRQSFGKNRLFHILGQVHKNVA